MSTPTTAHALLFGTPPEPGHLLDVHTTALDAHGRSQRSSRTGQLAADADVAALLAECTTALAGSPTGIVQVVKRVPGQRGGGGARMVTADTLRRYAADAGLDCDGVAEVAPTALHPLARTSLAVSRATDGGTAIGTAALQTLSDVLVAYAPALTRPAAPANLPSAAAAIDSAQGTSALLSEVQSIGDGVEMLTRWVLSADTRFAAVSSQLEALTETVQAQSETIAALLQQAQLLLTAKS